MKTLSLPRQDNHVPDATSERRMTEIPESPADHYDTLPLKGSQRRKGTSWYSFVGGTASAAALTACIADWLSGDDRLVNHARWVAAGGGLLSGILLTDNPGGPHWFADMTDAFKRQSPMRTGAWTLLIFSTVCGAAAFANQMRQEVDAMPILILENVSGTIAAIMGLMMSSRSGKLSEGNAVPLRKEIHYPSAHFATSGMNSAVSILELIGHNESRALNLLGLASAAYESLEDLMLANRHKHPVETDGNGENGLMVRASNLLSGPLPLLLRLAHTITGNRGLRRAAAYFSLAGSLLTGFGRLDDSKASANHHRLELEVVA